MLVYLSYATICGLWVASQYVEIHYVVHLLALVTAILYAACHSSLVLLEEQAKVQDEKEKSKKDPNYKSEEPLTRTETLGKEEAMQFPIMGSASLFSLYLAFKFLPRDLVNLLISFYFCMVGWVALSITFAPLLTTIISSISTSLSEKKVKKEIKINHSLPEWLAGESPWDLSIEITFPEILSFIGSAIFSVFYFKYKHWAMNNVLGICFCLQGIERFSLGTYKIGAILLVGLFFYDIFWVFGTEVMVTVAKNLDGPIKILFPRTLVPNEETGKIETSLLGLGDIVIPGFFLALLLRFDAHNAKIKLLPTVDIYSNFPKPYFHWTLISYILGMGTTMYVMITFQAAQPALLYLVPACLGSSFICAIVRGELKELLSYSEEEEEEEEETGSETKSDGEEKVDSETKKEN